MEHILARLVNIHFMAHRVSGRCRGAGIGISPIPEPIEVPIVLALANLFKVELLPSAFLNKINYSKMDTAGGTSEEEPYSIDEKLNNRYEK